MSIICQVRVLSAAVITIKNNQAALHEEVVVPVIVHLVPCPIEAIKRLFSLTYVCCLADVYTYGIGSKKRDISINL